MSVIGPERHAADSVLQAFAESFSAAGDWHLGKWPCAQLLLLPDAAAEEDDVSAAPGRSAEGDFHKGLQEVVDESAGAATGFVTVSAAGAAANSRN